jgi:hypothetical protein
MAAEAKARTEHAASKKKKKAKQRQNSGIDKHQLVTQPP